MKKYIALFLAAIICLSMAACSAPAEAPVEEAAPTTVETKNETEEPATSEDSKEGIVVGVDYATSDKFNLQVVNRVNEMCEERGWTCLMAEGQRDAEKTLSNVDTFITKGAKYVLVVGIDETMQTSVQEKCESAGVIPVFTSGSSAEGFTVVGGSGTSAEIAAAVTEVLAAEAKERWGSVDLAIMTLNSTQGEIADDMFNAVSEVYNRVLGVKPEDILVIDCPWDNMKASELYTNMFTAHPDAEHIIAYGFVDLHHAVPLYNAAKVAGKLDNLIMGADNIADDTTQYCMQESPKTWIIEAPTSGAINGEVFMDLVIDHEENGVPIEKRVYNAKGGVVLATPDEIASYYEE